MVTVDNLRQLISVMDAKLALLGPHQAGEDADKTVQRTAAEAKRAEYAAELTARTADFRLPYNDGET